MNQLKESFILLYLLPFNALPVETTAVTPDCIATSSQNLLAMNAAIQTFLDVSTKFLEPINKLPDHKRP